MPWWSWSTVRDRYRNLLVNHPMGRLPGLRSPRAVPRSRDLVDGRPLALYSELVRRIGTDHVVNDFVSVRPPPRGPLRNSGGDVAATSSKVAQAAQPLILPLSTHHGKMTRRYGHQRLQSAGAIRALAKHLGRIRG